MKGALGLIVLAPLVVLSAQVWIRIWPFVPMAALLFVGLAFWRKK